MLSDIIAHAIAEEPDMAIAESALEADESLAAYTRRKKIDVIIFSSAAGLFDAARIEDLLHANPRLGLLEVSGRRDGGVLHHLLPAHEEIGALAQQSLAAAIRAGAALRRR